MYPVMFSVDFDQCPIESARFQIELSFTFVHWNLIEQLKAGELSINDVDEQQAEALCYNILPGGNTYVHKLAQSCEALEGLYKIAQPNDDDLTEHFFHVPFICNFEQKCAMHICVENHDFRVLDVLLKYLSGYGIDHHSRAICEILPILVDHSLPSLNAYLNSRLLETEQTKIIKKGQPKDARGLTTASVWYNATDVNTALFKKTLEGVELEVKVEILDMPNVISYSEKAHEDYFAALAGADCSLFAEKSVNKVVDYMWPEVQNAIK